VTEPGGREYRPGEPTKQNADERRARSGRRPSSAAVPERNLHRVPFASLSDDTSGEYLLQKRVASYAPSGTVLVLLRNRPNPGRNDLLAVGGVPYSSEPAQARPRRNPWNIFRGLESLRRDEMTALPGTVEEVSEIRTVLRNARSTVLSGNRATETNFKL
jgi:CHAT domain-containing protein